jgi:NAD(P)H-flavin reductase
MTAKKTLGRLVGKTNLAGNTWLLRVEFEETQVFVPGQFVSLKVNEEGLRRSYSVASLPGENSIDLVVDVTPMGVGSKYILSLNVGDMVEVLGYLGKFTVKEETIRKERVLFVGTGVGVVPLKPMAEDLLANKQYGGQIDLVWGMRYKPDLFWQKEMDLLQKKHGGFHLEVVLSKPDDDWTGSRGHVGEVIDGLSINWAETTVFLCGNPLMITEMREKLINKGVPVTQIFFERFA